MLADRHPAQAEPFGDRLIRQPVCDQASDLLLDGGQRCRLGCRGSGVNDSLHVSPPTTSLGDAPHTMQTVQRPGLDAAASRTDRVRSGEDALLIRSTATTG
ncbi:MAG TPA: hypothetical protein VFH48_46305 [Chloroflexota bacterium]|nr:hypothetical protein [Chloroflexota bacterium]